MSDLTEFRNHCRRMADALHRPECLQRPNPWSKQVPTCGALACVTDSDRLLFARLADEADAYLSRDIHPTLL